MSQLEKLIEKGKEHLENLDEEALEDFPIKDFSYFSYSPVCYAEGFDEGFLYAIKWLYKHHLVRDMDAY